MSKTICLITPGHIATNPRLLKEASAFIKAGYSVHIIFSQYMDYLIAEDFAILNKEKKCSFSNLVWTNKSFGRRLYSGIIQKIALLIGGRRKSANIFTKVILNRNYQWQFQEALKAKADLYIAHNAGAIAVAGDAAKKNNAKFAFDAEDFHRGENLSDLVKRGLILIEDHYLPIADYITAASPLIAKEYEQLYKKSISTILNVFPKPNLPQMEKQNFNGLKLFWFSQTIGFDRGIEVVIEAMGKINNPLLSLHLLGNHNEQIKIQFNELAISFGLQTSQLHFYSPISPDEIFAFANQFDVGLATETGIPYNRDICLTNKIFTYVQSGLAVIASDTAAQYKLIQDYPQLGLIYNKEESNQLISILSRYLIAPHELQLAKQNSLALAQEVFNWEIEQQKFLQIYGLN